MTDSFLIYGPPVVDIGLGSSNNIGRYIRSFDCSKVLVVSDAGIQQAGLTGEVEGILQNAHIGYRCFTDIEPEPSIATVDRCLTYALEEGIDGIVAVGGGSVIDVAKSVAICCKGEENVRAFLGFDKVKAPGIRTVVIPTTSGTGSEASMSAVLTDERNNTKTAVWSRYVVPDVAVIDPQMTRSMPPSVTADTGADALSHAVEAYVSLRSNTITDMYARAALAIIGSCFKSAYDNGDDLFVRQKMAEASYLAGMAFSNCGLGAGHALAYPFTMRYGHSHGRANAIILPAVMRYNCEAAQEKYRDIAAALGEDLTGLTARDAALRAPRAVEDLLNGVDIATRISQYGIGEDDLQAMAEVAVTKGQRLLVTNPREVTIGDAVAIYEDAYRR